MDDNINKINMRFLLNKQYNVNSKDNSEKNDSSICNNDLKFYKKRIIDISKKIINNEIENNETNSSIINSFNLFANNCIKHFKTIDINDEYQSNFKDIVKQLIKTNQSRVPVRNDSLDDIVGILHIKDVLANLFLKEKLNIKSLLKKPFFVSPSISLLDL